jgi:hypothetical protein
MIVLHVVPPFYQIILSLGRQPTGRSSSLFVIVLPINRIAGEKTLEQKTPSSDPRCQE